MRERGKGLIADKIKVSCVNLRQQNGEENKTRTLVGLKRELAERYFVLFSFSKHIKVTQGKKKTP